MYSQDWDPVVLRRRGVHAAPRRSVVVASDDSDAVRVRAPLAAFGARVAEVRLRRGVRTQAELAALVSEPVAVIAGIEAGRVAPQPTITKINAALGLFRTPDLLRPPRSRCGDRGPCTRP